ncbi:methionine--tRNA ligase [Candidatus Curtissbacteria bacterium]|nr:methionine--tRNA ligase [Candidatus Curtissbacteria bacterium]
MAKKVYLTTAIPYVNAAPHIGFALEAVMSDCYVRYQRLLGNDVYFSSGADENSLKNVQAAEAEGISTKELVDRNAKLFEDLKPALNLTWDVFNRTSDARHIKGAQKLWSLCKKEDIYKKNYKGLYCVGCEAFYTPLEIKDGKCPDGHTNIDKVEEENYFFKLSNYQEFLRELIKKDSLKIIPQTRKKEVLAFIEGGLEDFSISRSVERARGWGVPVPGDDSQVMYVWFDALVTYLTALGFAREEKLFGKFWTTNPNRIHVIGKGIIRFHAVYWIAMLASAGVPLPTLEFVHGYITIEGQKISKTLGNVIDPFEMVKKYGSEVIRYYLLREIPSWGDGDFSEKRLVEIYNGELANGLGNLVARVARLCQEVSLKLPKKGKYVFLKEVSANLDKFRFDHAAFAIWEEVSRLDKLINDEKPWEKDGKALKSVITPIASAIREIAYNLSPFMPETSERIMQQFNGEIKSEKPLFPRL